MFKIYCIVQSLGEKDYDPGPYHVVFPAGKTSVPFSIPIFYSDSLQTRRFTLTINSSTLPNHLTVINDMDGRGKTTVAIIDDDNRE